MVPYANLTKEDLMKVLVWVQLHNVPMVAFISDRLSMIATKLGNSIMLDSHKSAISMESCGRSSVAHALIELEATCVFNDMLVVENFKLEGKVLVTHVTISLKKPSTSNLKLKDAKQEDVEDDGFQRECETEEKIVIGTTKIMGTMDDLVDDTKKKVEAPPMKTGIWLGRKMDSPKRNVVYSLETKLHYYDRDDMECS
ncbi:hypothetical protein Tco_1292254 [Tanacetum coccineum]